ncbi:xanthine dehydrogenase family protein molybdopterin-binding subunit [Sulfobacillus harzensis]|uniref:Xanthine dehydrogenase family protein molybdopterin-binding subunit n=1 Tax=Sulfobacillus harzensis TaxID=2729629 RepID=A0A7Y0L6K0_9FIRM|nr:xanthine dehydrogenase family protein molybdopterin-binding subunit [Sulfobacillus harzensis]NMP23857.1 xanthine dehydrogenase family protein molybdopterin-binding subunit [Sulfobacillus harzensis]
MSIIGTRVPRKEAPNKVTGRARYTNDINIPGTLSAVIVPARRAHGEILSIDTTEAKKVPGVKTVITGDDLSVLTGDVTQDRPPLAKDKVRYWGEPVALVVARDESAARRAAALVKVRIKPLPAVNSIQEALAPGAPLVHEKNGDYTVATPPVYPKKKSNVADHANVKKGDIDQGMKKSDVKVTVHVSLPQIDHAAMEPRVAKAEILADGRVLIHASTQAPFEVQKLVAQYFHLNPGQVIVTAPLVGGAFGGKAAIQLEILAYIASKAVGGQMVKIVNTREEDLTMSPLGLGLEADITLGASKDGHIQAANMSFYMDIGAYTDSAPRIARAIAAQCTGPYHIANVHTDVFCVYTNHTYTTAFRGFGHMPMTFAVERAMDELARALNMDSLDLRLKNAIHIDDITPTKARLTRSNLGDLPACLKEMRRLIGWQGGRVEAVGPHRVRTQGVAAFWKTSSSPPNAVSGAIITMNSDGSVNLSTGAVEFGPGTKTTAAMILAEKLRIPLDRVFVHEDVNTSVDPEHWKTVASLSTYMVGRAVLDAANDLLRQLISLAAVVLRCAPDDLDYGDEKVFVRDDPSINIKFSDLALGYKYAEGDSIGGQLMGRGRFMIRHLNLLDQETGHGKPGPAWTVGVQAVEVEYDQETHQYRILKAATVLDAGRVINPQVATGQVMGGMNMGIGVASREGVHYGPDGEFLNPQFRSYKVMRMGEQPQQYLVEFVETPQMDSPYGARPLGEHAVLAIGAALANALSRAADTPLNTLPITPEMIWKERRARS